VTRSLGPVRAPQLNKRQKVGYSILGKEVGTIYVACDRVVAVSPAASYAEIASGRLRRNLEAAGMSDADAQNEHLGRTNLLEGESVILLILFFCLIVRDLTHHPKTSMREFTSMKSATRIVTGTFDLVQTEPRPIVLHRESEGAHETRAMSTICFRAKRSRASITGTVALNAVAVMTRNVGVTMTVDTICTVPITGVLSAPSRVGVEFGVALAVAVAITVAITVAVAVAVGRRGGAGVTTGGGTGAGAGVEVEVEAGFAPVVAPSRLIGAPRATPRRTPSPLAECRALFFWAELDANRSTFRWNGSAFLFTAVLLLFGAHIYWFGSRIWMLLDTFLLFWRINRLNAAPFCCRKTPHERSPLQSLAVPMSHGVLPSPNSALSDPSLSQSQLVSPGHPIGGGRSPPQSQKKYFP
jgi:hypothetical protein